MSKLNALYTFWNVFIDNGFVYTTLQLLKTSSRLIWNEKKKMGVFDNIARKWYEYYWKE